MDRKPDMRNNSGSCGFFWCDLKRMFRSPGLYLAMFLSLFILLRPLAGAFTGKAEGTFVQFMATPFASSGYTPFAAIFSVIPFAASFCSDFNSGYVRAIAVRIGAKRYARQRCLTVMLSGGFIMATAFGAVILICAVLANVPETAETAAFMRMSIWAKMGVLVEHPVVLALSKIFLAFLFGAVWAVVGLTVSVLCVNPYITCIAPFVLYQALWLLLEGSAFNPVYYLRGDSDFIPSFEFAVAYQGGWILVCFLISSVGIRKRVEKG